MNQVFQRKQNKYIPFDKKLKRRELFQQQASQIHKIDANVCHPYTMQRDNKLMKQK